MIDQIRRKWEHTTVCGKVKYGQYPWQYAGGLIVCMGVTAAICVFILISEIIISNIDHKRKKRYVLNRGMVNLNPEHELVDRRKKGIKFFGIP